VNHSGIATGPPSGSGPSSQRVRVLLVDDQAMIGEAVRRMLVGEQELEFLYCGDPGEAIRMANEFRPTVILQDLVMPEVDGLSMLRFFRANPATKDVPMIVLSTKEEPKVKAEAFALGANDYLVKLPDPIELGARIRHHSAGYVAQIERRAAYAALKKSQERLAEELSEAGKYVISLLPPPLKGEVATDWRFIPSVELGGDAFGYHWIDPDHFALYLLDVCGHGVKAALLSISAMNVLRTETLPATDFRQPSQVLSGMNDAFQMDRHDGMYFTLWYGVYERSTRQLSFANGGHPPAVLFAGPSADAAEPVELSNHGMIVGAFPGTTFDQQVRLLSDFSRLYVFSDGIYEVSRPDGPMLTFQEFVDILSSESKSPVSPVERTIDRIRAEHGQEDFEDDVSIIEVTF
jgi:sigma-B regulation protein RsbU (phosphoserine phosphatase)